MQVVERDGKTEFNNHRKKLEDFGVAVTGDAFPLAWTTAVSGVKAGGPSRRSGSWTCSGITLNPAFCRRALSTPKRDRPATRLMRLPRPVVKDYACPFPGLRSNPFF